MTTGGLAGTCSWPIRSLGVGAGNYPESYFRDRRTTEAIQNPHSLELQTLAELGVPGVMLLALLFAGIGLAIVRLRGPARAVSGRAHGHGRGHRHSRRMAG